MRRARFVLLALAAAFAVALLAAGPALQRRRPSIDAHDDAPGSRWEPANVTIDEGDTVSWEFDEAQTRRTTSSPSSDNWTLEQRPEVATGRRGRRVHVRRRPAPTRSCCQIHPGTMTGSVTVEDGAPADPLSERPRVLQDRRLPPRLDPAGHRGDPAARRRERLHRRRDRGRGRVHRREPRPVRRRRLPLHDRRRARRHPAGRVRALHPGRRRLRRRPRRGRHRVHVAVVRRDARRLLPQPPRRHADRRRSTSRTATSRPRPACRPRWTRTDEWYNFQNPVNPVGAAAAAPTTARATATCTCSRRSTSRPTTRTTATPPTTTTRSRGARSSTAAASGTRRWATPQGSFAEPRASARTCSAACARPRAPPADCGEPRRGAAAERRRTSRRSRSTTTPRTRWSSTSRPTGACSTSSATAASMIWKPDTEPDGRRPARSR